MNEATELPPGQYEVKEFPRFGLIQFANRLPKQVNDVQLKIAGDIKESITVSDELHKLPRGEKTSDFHCVTTWSKRSLRWSGYRFSDFFEQIVLPQAQPDKDATFVILHCQDGARTSLPLVDLLENSVLLADTLNGAPLSIEHGAPIRLIAPAHYGYKNPKHVSRIEFWTDDRKYRPPAFKFMDHPRARVAFEERGTGVPGWLLRYLYRPLIRPTIRQFQRAMSD